jgi:16S rRNA (guanine966-N2)-methyltransferase
MRIIAGRWRGRTLAAAPAAATRPTADRVREALFSMLTSRLGSFEGLNVLDGFAGTGALGLEALSRGAERAWLIEQDRAAAAACTANIRALGANATLITAPVASLGPAPAACDLVMLDPPYGEGLAGPALAHLLARGWIGPHAIISVETGAKEPLVGVPEGWETLASRSHGKAAIHLLRAGPEA